MRRHIVSADKKLITKQPELLAKGLELNAQAPNTVTVEDYEKMTAEDVFIFDEEEK